MVHSFEQAVGAPVRICSAYIFSGLCGKWPDHHVHTGDEATCTCDGCRSDDPLKRLVARLTEAIDGMEGSGRPGPPPVGYIVNGNACLPQEVQIVYDTAEGAEANRRLSASPSAWLSSGRSWSSAHRSGGIAAVTRTACTSSLAITA